MANKALTIIDVQNMLVSEVPYNVNLMIDSINKAIDLFRKRSEPIIFIQHTNDELVENSFDWEVSQKLNIEPSDIRINKSFNSMFKDTNLEDVLTDYKIDSLVICGMQTDYCVDTSIKVAFEKNYEIYVLKDGFTTFDTDIINADTINKHYENVWENSFGKIIDTNKLTEI